MSIQTEIKLDVNQYIKPLQATVRATADATTFIVNSFNKVKQSMDLKAPKVDVSNISASAKKIELELEKAGVEAAKSFTEFGKDAGENFGKGITPELKNVNSKIKQSFSSGIKDAFKEGQAEAAGGGGMFGSLATKLGNLASPAGLAAAGLGAITVGLATTIKLGSQFETSLAAVGAITGQSGKDLKILGDNARDLAKKFGGDATTQLASFQGILSRFGADLSKSPEQLKKLADNINILGKAGGLDAAQSMDALTNSMLQFGVDIKNPNEAAKESTRFINALAKSAEVGAAEIPQVAEAILVAGVAAKKANVSFEETNAAIQVLAAGGKTGAEAGTALRNVLGKIAGEDVIPEEALKKLKSLGVDMSIVSDTTRPLSERLKELGKANKDATAFTQLFGAENSAAASILADGAEQMGIWTKEITGSDAATKQATKNMDTLAERVSRFKSFLEDVAIGAFMNVSPEVNASLDKATKAIEAIVKFVVDNLPGAIAVLGEWWGLLSEIGELLYNAVAAPIKAIGIIFKSNNATTKESTTIFQTLQGVIKTVAGWFSWLNDTIDENIKKFTNAIAVVKDFLGLEKLKAPIKNAENGMDALAKKADITRKRLGEAIPTPDIKMGEVIPPNTDAVKKEFTNLSDYIQGIKSRISDIDFNMKMSNEDAVIRDIEKQIKDVAQNVSLSESAKIDLSVKLETRKAILDNEKELEKLAEANKKTIEGIEKDFADKTKGASKSSILAAEKEKNKLLAAETDKYHSDSFDLIMKFNALTENIQSESTKKKVDLAKKESKILRDLQVENLTDEKAKSYQKDLNNLKDKFTADIEANKGNNAIKFKLFKKYQKDITDLQAKSIETPATGLDALKAFQDTFSKTIMSSTKDETTAREDELKKQETDLENSLRSKTFSYSEYIDGIKSLEQNRLDAEKEANSQRSALLNALLESTSVAMTSISTQLTLEINKAFEAGNSFVSTMETSMTAVAGFVGATFGASIAQGDSLLQALGKAAIDTAQTLLNAYAAPLLLKKSLEYPFGLGAIEFGILLAAANGLLAYARSSLGGASEGVVDLSQKNKGRPGYGDTIPMMLRRGESVINPEGTSKYKDIIKQINAGTYNYKADNNAGRIGLAIDKSGTLTEQKEKQYVNEIVSLHGVIKELKSEISNMSTNSHSRMDFEFSNHSEIDGNHINLVSDRIRQKAIKRF